MKIKQMILVSGLSGAGKSSVMTILEDLGYLCIDNFPLGLLDTLLDWIEQNDDARYYYLALCSTAKDFSAVYDHLQGAISNLKALFLDAEDSVLVQRYQFTRNRHPFIVSGIATTLQGAITKERQQLSGLSDEVLRIDTTHLATKDLKLLIEANYGKGQDKNRLSLSFVSFGFRYGLPLDADIVFDVRFLINPFWQEDLRKLTGNDQAVIDYVFNDGRTKVLLAKMQDYLDYNFAEFLKDQKTHITIAVGCTGGKHRSVAIINYLVKIYQDRYHTLKLHRDLGRK